MDVLRGNAHKSAAAIQRALACAGFSRSIGAIEERRRLTIGGVAAAREDADLMTTRELGDLLGVSDETVARWIKRKDLAATLATDVGNFSHGTYLITRAAVRRFVLSNAVRLPAQGVDLVWLVDLLRGA